MQRIVAVALMTSAVVAVGLPGCSGKTHTAASSSSKTSSSAPSAPNTSAPAPAPTTTAPTETQTAEGTATLTVDGKGKDFKGQVSCSTNLDATNIVISQPTSTISIVISEDASHVQSVGIGSVDDVSLSFQEHAPGVEASATRDGNNYTVKGTGVGYDKNNPDKQIIKPFEISVTCP